MLKYYYIYNLDGWLNKLYKFHPRLKIKVLVSMRLARPRLSTPDHGDCSAGRLAQAEEGDEDNKDGAF